MARINRRQFLECSADTEFSLNIKTNGNTPLPPVTSAQVFNLRGGFDSETVISRKADGSVLSRFKDQVWDLAEFTRLGDRRSGSMYFTFGDKVTNEAKTLINLAMITPTVKRLSINRCFDFYHIVKRIAEISIAEKTTIKTLFNAKRGIRIAKMVGKEVPHVAKNLITLSEMLGFMSTHGGFNHGFRPLGRKALSLLVKINLDYKESVQQTPVIPSRILKQMYLDTITEYESLLPVLDELLKMQSEIDLHPMVGISLHTQKRNCRQHCGTCFGSLDVKYPTDHELGGKYPLAREFLNRHFSRSNHKSQLDTYGFEVLYDKRSVLYGINYVQRVCQDMIIMFTGMRTLEACLLPYFGSKETVVDGVKYWLIYGFAIKKQSDNRPVEMWVTNEYGYKAFQTAKRISDLYYRRNQREPLRDMPVDGITPELSPLYLRDDGDIDKRFGGKKKTPVLVNSYVITQSDSDELKMIDPHRGWNEDHDFEIGKPFPVELRMMRRSIAFFASASGVSLVDLKNQLHHLFESQTFYYGRGSGRANPFLKNRDSFASYFNQVKNEAEAFSYINEVIDFDGKLFGASAEYAERNDSYHTAILNEDRAETIKRIDRGEFAYMQTHVGGCKSVVPCKFRALGSLTACLSCKDAVINPVKLSNVIKEQAHFVDGLNPERLEFRTENEELFVMLDYAIKNIDSAVKNLDRRKKEYKQFSLWRKEFKQIKKTYMNQLNENRSVA